LPLSPGAQFHGGRRLLQGHLQGAAWTRLADKARRTRGDRLQRIIGLGVTTRAGQDTDIELIRRVFPQAHPMTIGARELSAYVQRLRQELRREKLKLQVEAEIQQAGLILVPPQPALLYPGQGTEMELQVKSGYAHLPVRLTALPFTARRPPLEVALQEPAATVELSPGAQGKLETVRLQVDRDGGLAALLRAFGLIPDEVGQVDLVQTVRVQARHQAALELLNLPPEWKVNLTGPLRFRVRPPVNPAWPWVALTALLLGMGHLLYRKSKVQLTGRLRVVKEGSSSTCDLTEKRGQRRRATLGSASRDQCDIFLPGATPQAPVLAIIEAVSARRVRVFTPDGQPHLLSRGGKTESLDLEDGTEFQLGGYRLIYQNPELRE
ncbi:MAG TPA: hypothetical protein VNO81_02350, partial [Candidatus Nitrosotenuis sp.]|nr:hypothetical protein [Candidatus Nitrosotenuis sp.]